MAETDNFSEINDNFDTIKTLLNSIRAQGILNTSDVDKLLSGINSKLEKINTDEDIDLIKAFLSELKQNLDERHNVLISKFGAIESLFSNLLKNSAEAPKSSELKELFDIVATNLSVFSREVVSQKETLTDITMRLDAMRSDDSQKKDIIKNITFLKNDLEKLNNGFDSIVLSLNENFTTVVKTISGIDQSEAVNNFGNQIKDILNSSNTILSALQLLDKKETQIEDNIALLATKDDLLNTKRGMAELTTQSKAMTDSIDTLVQKSYKVDTLADKIDASVNIIAGLKSIITESDDKTIQEIGDRIAKLENSLKEIASNKEFDEFKLNLESTLNDVSVRFDSLKKIFLDSNESIYKLSDAMQALDINVNFKTLSSEIEKQTDSVKNQLLSESDKLSQLIDVNITRTINDITSNTAALNSNLKDASSAISDLCIKNFDEVLQTIGVLKTIVGQIDENNVSANNAIFSNITDRLTIFENSLKSSLDKQEEFVTNSSKQVFEQVENVSELTNGLEYKLDSSMLEISNSRKELENLKDAVSGLLALDFVNVVKNLRVDLYAVKQELADAFETSSSDINEKFSNDLFSKYELLISKLDTVEDEIKDTQKSALSDLKHSLEGISSSIVDVLSYVSESKESGTSAFDTKLNEISGFIKDSNLTYLENVRDVVDVIRIQIENNLRSISSDISGKIDSINSTAEKNTAAIKQDIQNSYYKLIELQKNFSEIKEAINTNNLDLKSDTDDILSAAGNLKTGFESKISELKSALVEKITDFRQEFLCDNADKISEIKFSSETMNNKILETSTELKKELQEQIVSLIGELSSNIETLSNNVSNLNNDIDNKVAEVVENVDKMDGSVSKLSTDMTNSLSSTLSKILENFVSLKSVANGIGEQTSAHINQCLEQIRGDFDLLRQDFSDADKIIDEDLSRQITIIDDNFRVLNNLVTDLIKENEINFSEQISKNLENVSQNMSSVIAEKLDSYKQDIEGVFDRIEIQKDEQNNYLRTKVAELNDFIENSVSKQNLDTAAQLEKLTNEIKSALDKNIELTTEDYANIKNNIAEFTNIIEEKNKALLSDLKIQLDEITGFLNSGFEIYSKEVNSTFEDISSNIQKVILSVREMDNELNSKVQSIQSEIIDFKEGAKQSYDEKIISLSDKLTELLLTQTDSNINSTVKQTEELRELIESLEDAVRNSLSDNMSTVVKRLDTLDEINEDRLEALKDEIITFKKENEEISDSKISDLSDRLIALLNTQNLSSSALAEKQSEEIKKLISELNESGKSSYSETAQSIVQKIDELNEMNTNLLEMIKVRFESELIPEIHNITDDIQSLFEQNYLNYITQLGNTNGKIFEELQRESISLKAEFEALNERLDKDELSKMNIYQAQIKEMSDSFNSLFENIIDTKADNLLVNIAEISDKEINSVEQYVNKLSEQVETVKENTTLCKDIVSQLIKDELDKVKQSIEKETDFILADLTEQCDILKNEQKDGLTAAASEIEGAVSGYIIDSINDLKNYLDIKSDDSVMSSKLDNLKTEMNNTTEEVLENINKLVEINVFTNAVSDLKTTNEVLITSMADKLNDQITDFVRANVSKKIDDTFNIFDKKFIDTVVDKYEELGLLISNYNNNVSEITSSIEDLLSKIEDNRDDLHKIANSIITDVNSSVCELKNEFLDLKVQILNKAFDDAFRSSLNNQITGIEDLVNSELGYLEDISDLCITNLPEISEMSAIVKHSIQNSINDIINKLNSDDNNLPLCLDKLKSEIVTTFINIFNQISFVAEQEEIIDFIQEKHSELITVLSHIVTTADGVETVKDNLAVVDDKVNNLRDDINLINEKITAIMSSDGKVDYVYSLQDLESDISNLKSALSDMKENTKPEYYDNLKQKIDSLADDIVSISTRTNKLLLTSDESQKTLQDNLQDFKLVINDLDERTRNFAHESGLDLIDKKLGTINSMMQNGEKTNQIFNQVFEYLAEWVDRAGAQIASISDRVETLNDIGQIKVMIEDLRAESHDSSDSTELADTLGSIFEKQAKKISKLEAKLDKIIVETNINENNHIDTAPLENTLNKFLQTMDEKLTSQQEKINLLESKLEEVMSIVDSKETAQLTKKVGGMDRQIAKLNKSIEKIASHVVEK